MSYKEKKASKQDPLEISGSADREKYTAANILLYANRPSFVASVLPDALLWYVDLLAANIAA